MGQSFGYQEGDFPVTEQLSGRLLRLPFYYEMAEGETQRVVQAVKEFLEKNIKRIPIPSLSIGQPMNK